MVKPKRRSEDLPFSSDDEIDSDDFDSDSDSGHEWREQESAPVIKSRNKYVTGLYSALGITEDEVQILKAEKDNADVCSGSQSATASVRSSSGRPPPEIIVFDDPAKRHKVAKTSTKVTRSDKMKERQTSVDKLTKTNELIDLNKARHEVRQFGIKGFEGAKKEDAVLDMLVKLGAKAPKKSYVNYKEYQLQRKKEKEEFATKKRLKEKAFGNRDGIAGKRKSKKGAKSDAPAEKKSGRFSSGVLRISSRDLKMMREGKTT